MNWNWPDGKRIAIMMAFDLDAETLWEARGDQDHISNLSRGTYGPIQGVPRILNMLDKYDAKATFFVPGMTALRYPEVIKEIVRSGHEIGYHGYIHNCSSNRDKEHADMLMVERYIEDLTGTRIVGQRAPNGTMYDFSLELFLEHGYIYSSNWRNSDGPFIHKIGGKEVPIVELPKDSIFDDTAYDMYVDIDRIGHPWQNLRSGREFTRIWMDEFDALAEEGRMINFVIHPQFIGRVSRINAVDRMMAYMKENGAWFETNGNVARHVLRQAGFEVTV